MRTILLILALLLGGCDGGTSSTTGGGATPLPNTVEPDTRPAFVLEASKPFVIEFGRGSGLHGYDVVTIRETGSVELHRMAGGQNVEVASLQLASSDVAKLVSLVNAQQLTGMGRTYSDPNLADGTQWILWIQQTPAEKSIYFNNSFPSQITTFANGLDTLVESAGLGKATWSRVPEQEGIDRQMALSTRIQPAR